MAGTLTTALARSFKSVERLLLFLAEVVSLFQGKLVILHVFPGWNSRLNPWGRQPDTGDGNYCCSHSAMAKAHQASRALLHLRTSF